MSNLANKIKFASTRLFSTSSSALAGLETTVNEETVQQMLKDNPRLKLHPRIGRREIVGFGINGEPTYFDWACLPCPAIRYKEEDAKLVELRKKEKGDWSNLSIEEKRELYRASFRLTLAEVEAPTGEWKAIVGLVGIFLSLTFWMYYGIRKSVYPPLPHTLSPEYREQTMERMIRQRVAPLTGPGWQWDYEKGDWKQ
ncbi:hypothetical protein SNEBB_009918 [Seison nebaliae]|nr:hypothetical protein SNEBB_009918 [Seison nebaliae]